MHSKVSVVSVMFGIVNKVSLNFITETRMKSHLHLGLKVSPYTSLLAWICSCFVISSI